MVLEPLLKARSEHFLGFKGAHSVCNGIIENGMLKTEA